MAISTDIEEIATEDAAPSAAPFKISAKVGKRTLTFKVKATASGVVRAVRVRLKPFNRNSGNLLYSRGMVCGSGDRCGSSSARSLVHSSPFTSPTLSVDEAVVASEVDGEYEVKAWSMETGAWSS
jgi:hypothetical protein